MSREEGQRATGRRQRRAEPWLESPLARVMRKHGSTFRGSSRLVKWGTDINRLNIDQRQLTPVVLAPVLVIGQQKAASTLLYSIVCHLFGIEDATRLKELNLFSYPLSCISSPRHDCSANLEPHLRPAARLSGRRPVRLFVDGTPDYFSDALAFAQIHAALPRARLLIVMRDPIERARSAWLQNAREGGDPRPFDKAVQEELTDLWHRCAPPDVWQRAARLPPTRRADALASHIAENSSSWYIHKGRRGAAWQIELVRALARGGGTRDRARYEIYSAQCIADWHDLWLKWGGVRCGSCHHYLARGLVARKLQVWKEAYGAQLLVMATETMLEQTVNETATIVTQLVDFLKLPLPERTRTEALVRGLARTRCWHPPCESNPLTNGTAARRMLVGAGRLTPETEATLIAFYSVDRAELHALEPRLVWPRWSLLPPRQPPPLSAHITQLLKTSPRRAHEQRSDAGDRATSGPSDLSMPMATRQPRHKLPRRPLSAAARRDARISEHSEYTRPEGLHPRHTARRYRRSDTAAS